MRLCSLAVWVGRNLGWEAPRGGVHCCALFEQRCPRARAPAFDGYMPVRPVVGVLSYTLLHSASEHCAQHRACQGTHQEQGHHSEPGPPFPQCARTATPCLPPCHSCLAARPLIIAPTQPAMMINGFVATQVCVLRAAGAAARSRRGRAPHAAGAPPAAGRRGRVPARAGTALVRPAPPAGSVAPRTLRAAAVRSIMRVLHRRVCGRSSRSSSRNKPPSQHAARSSRRSSRSRCSRCSSSRRSKP